MYLNNQFHPTNLILIRGIPGSGKSTLAKLLNPDKHFEADMFFENRSGQQSYLWILECIHWGRWGNTRQTNGVSSQISQSTESLQ